DHADERLPGGRAERSRQAVHQELFRAPQDGVRDGPVAAERDRLDARRARRAVPRVAFELPALREEGCEARLLGPLLTLVVGPDDVDPELARVACVAVAPGLRRHDVRAGARLEPTLEPFAREDVLHGAPLVDHVLDAHPTRPDASLSLITTGRS